MCCDVCPKYLDCEKKNRLKEECCTQCPEYNYCTNENQYEDMDDNEDMDNNRDLRHYY